MDQHALHLFCAYPDDLLDEETAAACARLLSDDERARRQAYRFEPNRREYLATHALLRTALSLHAEPAPAAWRFTKNAHGKPAIEPECGLHFNVSNAPGLVVCLVASGREVGVDIEPHTRAASISEVAQKVFSPQELAQLQQLGSEEQLTRCLHLWTLKEAYVKARGMGMALPMSKFSFVFDQPGNPRLEIDAALGDDSARWRFCLLNHAGHSVALVVESASPCKLKVWEARPPIAPPDLIAPAHTEWFPAP